MTDASLTNDLRTTEAVNNATHSTGLTYHPHFNSSVKSDRAHERTHLHKDTNTYIRIHIHTHIQRHTQTHTIVH